VRIIGLPRGGEVRIDGKAVQMDTVVTVEKFMTATFKPVGPGLGAAGSVDILVEDGRGGSVTGSLQITVISSHHPPVVEAPRTVQVRYVGLQIRPPTSPDDDPLTITVKALPRGQVYNGTVPLRVGDRLKSRDLADLIFVPDAGGAGAGGAFRYDVNGGDKMCQIAA